MTAIAINAAASVLNFYIWKRHGENPMNLWVSGFCAAAAFAIAMILIAANGLPSG